MTTSVKWANTSADAPRSQVQGLLYAHACIDSSNDNSTVIVDSGNASFTPSTAPKFQAYLWQHFDNSPSSGMRPSALVAVVNEDLRLAGALLLCLSVAPQTSSA